MALLQQYFWLGLIVVIIFVCLLIAVIFVFINMCILKKGKHRILQDHRDSEDKERKPQEWAQDTPPLPPRTQFLYAEAQSYENFAKLPDDEPKTMSHDLHNNRKNEAALPGHTQIRDQQFWRDQNLYKDPTSSNLHNQDQKLTNHHNQNLNLHNRDQSLTRLGIQDHYLSNLTNQEQNLGTLHDQDTDYEEIPDEQSDYVELEDQEEEVLPLVLSHEKTLDLSEDTEDYDDIDEKDQDEECYDDVV
ncbi:uncharacterized protein LOC133491795 [Syngnathoides biaculeatus]|uniref:uncharacterized protein LOC133491795 n=1 Tax=Syngnathoides biaculeatus TaxID=300417 RepID=UPI002ADD88CD|nr:uncharacterized protein LOC133491795 [Syngnathoides biaculeatus]